MNKILTRTAANFTATHLDSRICGWPRWILCDLDVTLEFSACPHMGPW